MVSKGLSRRLHVDANPARGTHRFALLARRSTASPFWCCRRRAFTATATSARWRERLLTGYFARKRKRQELVGQRPSSAAVATSVVRLHLSLLGKFQRVVDLNTKVSDGAFELGVAEPQLNRPEIPGSSIN